MFEITEKIGDLFDSDYEYIAHCISADAKMGAGFAQQVVRRFENVRQQVLDQNPYVGKAVLTPKVIHLVTKAKYYQKPTNASLRVAMGSMRDLCAKYHIKSVVMPRIGCGLDKLVWKEVKDIIIDVFKDTNISITVYTIGGS
jgi:O-acetyl-ADP-ribose deacetylase (regulator of RNase III)